MPSAPEKNAFYVGRSHVRKFLRTYAPPSALDELLDSIEDESWAQLVREVRTELVGEPGK